MKCEILIHRQKGTGEDIHYNGMFINSHEYPLSLRRVLEEIHEAIEDECFIDFNNLDKAIFDYVENMRYVENE